MASKKVDASKKRKLREALEEDDDNFDPQKFYGERWDKFVKLTTQGKELKKQLADSKKQWGEAVSRAREYSEKLPGGKWRSDKVKSKWEDMLKLKQTHPDRLAFEKDFVRQVYPSAKIHQELPGKISSLKEKKTDTKRRVNSGVKKMRKQAELIDESFAASEPEKPIENTAPHTPSPPTQNAPPATTTTNGEKEKEEKK